MIKQDIRAPGNKALYAFPIILIAGIAMLVSYILTLQDNLIKTSALHSAELYSQALSEFRTIYTDRVVRPITQGSNIEVTHDYQSKHLAIPLPATLSMELGKEIGKHLSGAETRLYSAYPFPWRNGTSSGLSDNFAQNAWTFLNKNPRQPYYQFVDDYKGQLMLRYAVADPMRPNCVHCHNTHSDSPKTDWQIGDVRGVLEVQYPLSMIISQAKLGTFKLYMLASGITIFGLVSLVLLLKGYRKYHQLLTAQANQLKQSSQAKSDFISRISNELLAATQSILKSGTELQQDKLTTQQRLDSTRKISEAGVYLKELLSEASDLNQIESGKLTITLIDCSFQALLTECINTVAHQAKEKGIQFINNTSSSNHHILTDATRYQQIVLNLLTNAIKYNQNLGLITLNYEVIDNRTLRLLVIDTGNGLITEDLNALFYLPSRIKMTANTDSIGIGLVISRHLAELMNGRIGAWSTPDKGSCFWVEMPLADHNAPNS